jgi:RNA polymerase sigma factor (sigma-70 family)
VRRAVINGCHTELRRRRVVRRAISRPPQLGIPAEDMYLLDALARLTPKRRIALTLRFYADLSEAQIATAMDVGVGTVKSLISRGLADLRKVVPR